MENEIKKYIETHKHSILKTKEIEIEKIKLRNLYDERDWKNITEINKINYKINKINEESRGIFAEYSKLNNEIYRRLNSFFKIKNHLITAIKNYSEHHQIDDSYFLKLTSKSKNIYNEIKEENKKINSFILNSKNDFMNLNLISKRLIKKYLIYGLASKINVDFFDLEEKPKHTSSFLKSKLILLKALLDNKPIVVISNPFSNIEKATELEKIETIYKNAFRTYDKSWILIENHVEKIQNIVDDVYIFQESKMIEYGNIKKITSKPFYKTTSDLLNLKKESTLELDVDQEAMQFDMFNKFDNYEVDDEHYVYGDLNQIYNKNNIVPKKFYWTNNSAWLDEFINNFNFKHEINENETLEINLNQQKTKPQETIIIDVRKKNNQLRNYKN